MSNDLHQLAVDLTMAAGSIDARKLVQVEAFTVKREWQAAWSDIRGLPHIARSVTYDTDDTADGAMAEIGPDPDRTQGRLDNIVEFGSSAHPPIRPVMEELERAADARLTAYVEKKVGDLL